MHDRGFIIFLRNTAALAPRSRARCPPTPLGEGDGCLLHVQFSTITYTGKEWGSDDVDWEAAWVNSPHHLPASASGDPVKTSERMLEKYRPLLAEAYSGKPALPDAKPPAGKTYENLGDPER